MTHFKQNVKKHAQYTINHTRHFVALNTKRNKTIIFFALLSPTIIPSISGQTSLKKTKIQNNYCLFISQPETIDL